MTSIATRAKPLGGAARSVRSVVRAPADSLATPHERFVFAMLNLVGKWVTVTVKSGQQFAGILHTCCPDKEIGVVLSMAREKLGPDEIIPKTEERMIILSSDFVQLTANDVDLYNDEVIEGTTKNHGEVLADTEIEVAGRGAGAERELEAATSWLAGAGDASLDLGSKSDMKAWDQFTFNEKHHGVVSSYNDELYTTKISDKQFSAEQLAMAERLAREIETKASTNAHVAEERGQKELDESGDMDEEEKYSMVLDPTRLANPPASAGGAAASTAAAEPKPLPPAAPAPAPSTATSAADSATTTPASAAPAVAAPAVAAPAAPAPAAAAPAAAAPAAAAPAAAAPSASTSSLKPPSKLRATASEFVPMRVQAARQPAGPPPPHGAPPAPPQGVPPGGMYPMQGGMMHMQGGGMPLSGPGMPQQGMVMAHMSHEQAQHAAQHQQQMAMMQQRSHMPPGANGMMVPMQQRPGMVLPTMPSGMPHPGMAGGPMMMQQGMMPNMMPQHNMYPSAMRPVPPHMPRMHGPGGPRMMPQGGIQQGGYPQGGISPQQMPMRGGQGSYSPNNMSGYAASPMQPRPEG
ncbi:hypothetical protein AB1Y20_023611 [Prymnesium parvum]|uniref:LsmAD domain-containing protein n=1 Tax=Prymnesium parvum TaxID=97485 RepID=A0AB34JE63_PRYPA